MDNLQPLQSLPGYAGWLFAFWMGAIVGSFLNVVVWRLPRGQSLNTPPSTCPKCGHRIMPWENIPILSWLFLRGRCSQCHLPISWRYPAGEAAMGVLFCLAAHRVIRSGLPLETVVGAWWLAGSALTLARIDFEHRMIPDKVTYAGMAAAAILALALPFGRAAIAAPAPLHSGAIFAGRALSAIREAIPGSPGTRMAALADCMLGALAGALIIAAARAIGNAYLKRLRKKGAAGLPEEAMGLGDLKMLAMTGAFLGADACVYITAAASMLAFFWCLIRNAGKNQPLSARSVAFAPFLAIPTLLWLVI